MKTIHLTIPIASDADSKDVAQFIAAKLFESGRLTLVQSAQIVGMRTAEFADVLLQYGVSFIN